MAAKEALQTSTKLLDLEGLSQSETVELACQLLDTDNISADLEKILVDKTHGIPLWCEELVSSMIESELLQKETESAVEEHDMEDGVPEPVPVEQPYSAVSRVSTSQPEVTMPELNTDSNRQTQRRKTVRFADNINPGDISVPDSITGMILARFDHLLPSAQMVLKCATVLGTTFARATLAAIVPNNMTEQVLNHTIASLASHGLIQCHHAAQVSDQSGSTEQLTEGVECPCLLQRQQHSIASSASIHSVGSPNHYAMLISECQLLEFVHPYVRDTLYDLWTNKQRTELHEKAALFLESQAHKCKNCGGGGFTLLGTTDTKPTRRQSLQPQGTAFTGASTRTVIQRNRRRSLTGNLLKNRVYPSDVASEEPHHAPMEEGCYVSEKRYSLVDSLLQQRRSSENSISSEELLGMPSVSFDLQDCYCDDILSKVYPQLICHWKAVGNNDKVLHYLMEAAGAAVTTFNNMEALSLLEEAQQLSSEEELTTNFTQHDEAELESLVGQVSHCMSFH